MSIDKALKKPQMCIAARREKSLKKFMLNDKLTYSGFETHTCAE